VNAAPDGPESASTGAASAVPYPVLDRHVDPERGLSAAQVAERVAAGLTNDAPNPTSRTVGEIVRANVFTRFNALLGVLLLAIFAIREFKDALFGIVLVLNALIGIIQEVRAKRTLDRLTLMAAPQARVRRDGDVVALAVAEVVLDDVIEMVPGDQIVVDGEVLTAVGLEVDESLLTGESDLVPKHPGTEVQSGSFVAAGTGVFRAEKVGTDTYAFKVRADAARFTLVKSELRDGINRIIGVVSWALIPTAILLIWAQARTNEHLTEAVQASVAGLVAMVPEGLVLLTSAALAIGVLRLGRKQVLTQELAAIEGLARIDTLCVDKTGTLTEGRLVLASVEPVGDHERAEAEAALAALGAADAAPNGSMQAVIDAFNLAPEEAGWETTETVPFSSARKWSANAFRAKGAWVFGAPDVMVANVAGSQAAALAEEVNAVASTGRRVLLLARADQGLSADVLPEPLVPVALVVLEEKIRPDAADTIAYFHRQDVTVKVISGDNPVTVGAVAARCGIPGADQPIDARDLPTDLLELAEVMETHHVFGRVTPHQKRDMVHALQSKGHEVAMTGDGVNDTLALKDAEIGIAMGSGSAAARAVARFVLLDNSFAVFPSVMAEGRRVIANVERVANLFLTKTVYALFMALATGVFGATYPFIPRHLTIISSLTIGVPAFLLALAPNSRRAVPGFLDRVLRFSVPCGIVAGVATFTVFNITRKQPDVSLAEARTAALVVLFAVAMWVLSILCRPVVWWRALLLAAMAAGFGLVFAIDGLRRYFAIESLHASVVPVVVACAVGAIVVIEVAWQVASRAHRRGKIGEIVSPWGTDG